MEASAPPYINRETSWLAFNGRVLQEAMNPDVPLLERLKFLAIFSSNLDEFFRVRVASLRSLLRLKKKKIGRLGFDPVRLLEDIHRIVTEQQEQFGAVFRDEILPALEAEGIFLVDETRVPAVHHAALTDLFETRIRPHLAPRFLEDGQEPFLENRALYLVVECRAGGFIEPPRYALVRVPADVLPRFVTLPEVEGRHDVMFLDDVIRFNLPRLFPDQEIGPVYAVKLTRDAELYIEDEFSGDLVEMIRKSLSKRQTGLPTRFLYDARTPYAVVSLLKRWFNLADEDLIVGGRYHNFSDFFSFPDFGKQHLLYAPLPPLPHPVLAAAPSVFAAMAMRDHLLHFPYQSFDEVVRFFREAARDEAVEAIWVSLYRVADDSAVTRALIEAAQRGKAVTAFVEIKARFDEASNLHWAEQMAEAGVCVLYSMPGLKVHAKIALVRRREAEGPRHYAYLGTGNFNEKTARLYTDYGLLTTDPRLTREVRTVFAYLEGTCPKPTFRHLLVAPFTLRRALYDCIDREIAHARAGRTAGMILKMNSLEDPDIIARLYQAAQAGVPIQLIIRGICCLAPGVPGLSETVTAISIVDRFLEHARVFVFHNDGDEAYYLASADWMRRNLSHRIEVAYPVYDEVLRRRLRAHLDLQRCDNTRARRLDAGLQNAYVERRPGTSAVRAQVDTYHLLQKEG